VKCQIAEITQGGAPKAIAISETLKRAEEILPDFN